MKPTNEQELREQIGDIFARACKNNEYFGNDGWYELHTPTLRAEIQSLILQERERAYRQGYNDNARNCYCDSPGATEGVLAHKHLLTDEVSSDVRPNIPEPCDYCKMNGREYTPECEANK